MRLFQRILFVAFFLLPYGLIGKGQTSKLPLPTPIQVSSPTIEDTLPMNPKDDRCPPAEVISDSYSTFKAKVVDVIDGNTLVVKSKDSKRKVIHMVGLSAPDIKTPFGIASKEHLTGLVLGKDIEVWLISTNSQTATNRAATGIVKIPVLDWLDINLEQIKAGLAQYKDFGPYTQDARDRCLYEKAETEARVGKMGIWAQ